MVGYLHIFKFVLQLGTNVCLISLWMHFFWGTVHPPLLRLLAASRMREAQLKGSRSTP